MNSGFYFDVLRNRFLPVETLILDCTLKQVTRPVNIILPLFVHDILSILTC